MKSIYYFTGLLFILTSCYTWEPVFDGSVEQSKLKESLTQEYVEPGDLIAIETFGRKYSDLQVTKIDDSVIYVMQRRYDMTYKEYLVYLPYVQTLSVSKPEAAYPIGGPYITAIVVIYLLTLI